MSSLNLFCTKCGTEAPSDSAFCYKCGNPLTKPEVAAQKSSPCGFKFACPHCGQHIAVTPEQIGLNAPCPGCGRSITVPSQKVCKHCGTAAQFESLFCYKCGNRLVKSDDPTPDSHSGSPARPEQIRPMKCYVSATRKIKRFTSCILCFTIFLIGALAYKSCSEGAAQAAIWDSDLDAAEKAQIFNEMSKKLGIPTQKRSALDLKIDAVKDKIFAILLPILLGIVCPLGALSCALGFFYYVALLFRHEPGVIIDDTGIQDFRSSLGLIAWGDIKSLKIDRSTFFRASDVLCIQLRDRPPITIVFGGLKPRFGDVSRFIQALHPEKVVA